MTAIACGTHVARIMSRNGALVSNAETLIEVSYSYVLDDVSSATIRVAPGGNCCESMGNVRAWANSLFLYRDGEPVWSGPVVSVDWEADVIIVNAVDILGWEERRVPHADYTFTDTDLTVIATTLINDGFAPDDPGHTVISMGDSGVIGGREYTENVGQTMDHLRDLADTGLDFTARGSTIILLPEDFCDSVGRISDEDLPEGLRVREDGASMATRQIVAGSEASGALGIAGGTDAYYGLLERYEEQTSITTQAAADSSAQAKLRASAAAPVFIDTSQVTLSPLTNIPLTSLVPGWCVDVASTATCRDITQRLKIVGVQVTETGGTIEDPGEERIVIQVAAPGLTDAQVATAQGLS